MNSEQEPVVDYKSQDDAQAALLEKLDDSLIPGFQVEFDPEEAERAGAFVEDALSEQDALESGIDLLPEEIEKGKADARRAYGPFKAGQTAQR